MVEGAFRPLDERAISGILPRGGTILRPRGRTRSTTEGGVERVLGDLGASTRWSRSAARTRWASRHGCTPSTARHVVGVPKTIDNDLTATDVTFGFDTAVAIATEAIDRLHTTAESHDRVMVCEVMGRHAGWIALHSRLAGGADVVLIPEQPMSVERCCELIARAATPRGKDFSIVVVSEG